MSNTLGVYNPIFYAQEGLIALEKALGMAGRVHRGHDKSPQQRGQTIQIPVPSSFEATSVNTSTGGTTQDLDTGSVAVTLDHWYEVKFALTDQELTYAGDRVIQDHVRPAAYALADKIDQTLVGLWCNVPWVSPVSSTPAVSDLTAARKVLFNNKVPMFDDNLHMMVSGSMEAGLLNLEAFSQFQGAGLDGAQTQMRGSLGRKFGFEVFANQNVDAYACGGAADVTGALDASLAKGASSISFSGVTAEAGFKKGDTFVLAGHSQRYVLTADATASTGGAVTSASFTPPAAASYATSSAVTFDLPASGVSKTQNLAFHRDAFALAMAPLTDMGSQLGAQVATVTDPLTGLALRSRLFYDADKSTIKVALDALWGVKCLNPNRAVRLQE